MSLTVRHVWAAIGIVSNGKNRASFEKVFETMRDNGNTREQIQEVIESGIRNRFLWTEGNVLISPKSEWPW